MKDIGERETRETGLNVLLAIAQGLAGWSGSRVYQMPSFGCILHFRMKIDEPKKSQPAAVYQAVRCVDINTGKKILPGLKAKYVDIHLP
jgi:hypothetical protein